MFQTPTTSKEIENLSDMELFKAWAKVRQAERRMRRTLQNRRIPAHLPVGFTPKPDNPT